MARLAGGAGGHVRFALGEPTTAGVSSGARLTVLSIAGRRAGEYTTNQLDAASIEAAVRSSEALARLAPEDPELVPPLGPQAYLPVEAWAEPTAAASPSLRADLVAAFTREARSRRLTAAGLCESSAAFTALAGAAGLWAYHRETRAGLTGTIRTPAGDGSGWAGATSVRIEDLDAQQLGRVAASKAERSVGAKPLPPGRYTVILDPAAVADLLAFLLSFMDARRTAEGRTPFSRPGGASALGEKIAAGVVTLRSDPAAAAAPSAPFDAEGSPVGRVTWMEGGLLRTLSTTRYWAGRTGATHVPPPTNFLMTGGTTATESMIRATTRGLLVTRFWYIRVVDPQTLLLTGLTRDGLFLIEKGEVVSAARNLRFNESPLQVLARVDMLGPAMRVRAAGGGAVLMEVPAVRSHEFNFTSVSDAI